MIRLIGMICLIISLFALFNGEERRFFKYVAAGIIIFTVGKVIHDDDY